VRAQTGHWSRPVRVMFIVVIGAGTLVTGLLWRVRRPALISPASRPITRIFEGFAFTGGKARTFPTRVPIHRPASVLKLDSRPLPDHFSSGHTYFFHHLRTGESMDFARTTLAPRLRADGFVMSESDNDIFVGGFIYWDERRGGRESFVTWTIRFSRNGCIGEIYHDLDPALEDLFFPVVQRIWEPANYILTVNGSCDL
jgi:hypothetical protein